MNAIDDRMRDSHVHGAQAAEASSSSKRSGAVPDVAALGGTIEFRQEDQLVITLPPRALAALKADPKVRYIEQVGGQPVPDDAPLIGVPADPQPGPASQPRRLTPQGLGTQQWTSGTYLYDGAGNIVSIGSDNYLYDGVQRLKQWVQSTPVETYTYDGFGNMKSRTNATIPTPDPVTNRYPYGYNEIGAVISDGSYSFTYDALGQPLSKEYNGDATTLEYYVYTPSDERIGVQRGGWWWWSVRDESGKVLRQYKSSATDSTVAALWVEDFVWRDGLLLGSQRLSEMGGRRHFHLDHLGSPRLITSDAGQMVSYHDYFPFGDEHSPISQEVPNGFDREEPMKFTGHERDYAGGMGAEDGHAIDDMHARYYSPTIGRFLSTDPILKIDYALLKPQAWNRYSYVQNNPIDSNDPDGRLDALQIISAAAGVALTANPLFLTSFYNDAVLDTIDPPPPAKNGQIIPTYAEFSIIAPFVPSAGEPRAIRLSPQAKGAAGEALSVQAAIERNETVRGTQITVRSESGTRMRVDVVTETPKNNIKLIEAKTARRRA